MTDTGFEQDPIDQTFRSLADVTKAAGELAAGMALFADSLASDSSAAMLSVNASLEGTVIAERWPLARTIFLRTLFGQVASEVIRRVNINSPSDLGIDSLEGSKYPLEEISDAYPDLDRPVLAFATDLIKWCQELNKRGREVITYISLGQNEATRVEVNVHEDVETARNYWRVRTDNQTTDRETGICYAWVGNRAVVSGKPDQIAILQHATQPYTE